MIRTALQRSSLAAGAGSSRPCLSALNSQVSLSQQRRTFKSRDEVNQACRLIESDTHGFIEKYVADDVMWTFSEPDGTSTPISGIYKSKKAVLEGAFKPLEKAFDGPLKLQLIDSVVQDRDNTDLTKVCLELKATAKLASNQKDWKNYYSWVMHFRKEQVIVVRSYVDSTSINHAMSGGE